MGTSHSVQQYKLRKLIASLSNKEGRGREFVSLYLPPEKPVDEAVAILEEKLDAGEIELENERGRIRDALTKVIHRLRLQKEIPKSGLALFAGTFPTNDEKGETVNILEIVPPEPIAAYLCEIDDHFDLEPLREMLREQATVGMIAMDSKEAGFGVANGSRVNVVEDITSGIPGKSGKGGQSQRRYERGRDMELTYYFHRVAEHAAKTFLEDSKVTGLIIGGPGQTKGDFEKGDYLHYELKRVLLATVDTLSSGKEGVREVSDKVPEILKNLHASEERELVQRLLADLGKRDGLAVTGLEPVLSAVKNGVVEVALVADNTDAIQLAIMCRRCASSRAVMIDKESKGKTVQEMISMRCEKCGASDYEVEERDIVDVLEDAASQTDARVEVVSSESEERTGLRELGGVAALLRYRPG